MSSLPQPEEQLSICILCTESYDKLHHRRVECARCHKGIGLSCYQRWILTAMEDRSQLAIQCPFVGECTHVNPPEYFHSLVSLDWLKFYKKARENLLWNRERAFLNQDFQLFVEQHKQRIFMLY